MLSWRGGKRKRLQSCSKDSVGAKAKDSTPAEKKSFVQKSLLQNTKFLEIDRYCKIDLGAEQVWNECLPGHFLCNSLEADKEKCCGNICSELKGHSSKPNKSTTAKVEEAESLDLASLEVPEIPNLKKK
uniref:Uncharacterized protein n=1 Tax=Tetraselmis sp. GSL018 TaxID=582737 RepID=A0A061QTP9_9CHLO|eukprot:CAMPEP_0177617732 /NCGR_PEP_ID=MMETSP0419_2-20121207/25097_1 /TAXON_ID=582737 /ORGANISM="Tetraselmis sp., Strain GSL018" /LENGTH=128 /DNA_ID=CAMNT_0019116379 /DNA_START=264 /DNA_END=650 /DNA_ORIENTATION=+